MAYSFPSKASTVFTQISKNVASFTQTVKNTIVNFLLKEDGYRLLTEDGGRIILEESDSYAFDSKNTS